MTGPEHYREAERLLATAAKVGDQITGESMPVEKVTAFTAMIATFTNAAQVHATLALAAATADAGGLDAWPS